MSDMPRSVLPYLHCASASTPRWLPGGHGLAFLSNVAGNWEAYAVAVPGHGGAPFWPDRLTFTGDRVGDVYPLPHHRGAYLVTADQGGDERWRILEVRLGSVRDLDPGEGLIRHLAEPAPDGDRFAFSSNRRAPHFFDVYVGTVAGRPPELVWQRDALMYPLAFSPDGSLLLVRETLPTKDQRLWLLPLDAAGRRSGEPRLLAAGRGDAPSRFDSPRWSRDGRTVYVVTDVDREFAALMAIDVASERRGVLYAPEAEVEEAALSPDGHSLAVIENRGASVVRLISADGREARTLLEGSGVVSQVSFAPNGDPRLAFLWDRPDHGQNVHVLYLEPHLTPHPVTRLPLGGLDPATFVAPREERVTVRDGLTVPALVFSPSGARGPQPAVWIVHGGPEGQSRPVFDPVTQFLVACGITVIKPNVRGSTGYGRTYEHADDVERRLDSVDDLADLVRQFVRLGLADPERQAVMGASYGGYMTLATLTRHPDLWCAGVDLVGIASLVTFLERTSPWRRPVREAEYGSLERDRAFLTEASPLTHADQIRAPLMVIHGRNDPRVPVEESEQIVAHLRAAGRPVDFLCYEDEGHGLTKLKNRTEAYDRVAAFLLKHMRLA
jgi:dipeptidyl aminopeptidase/acylaminoacyl peptidase